MDPLDGTRFSAKSSVAGTNRAQGRWGMDAGMSNKKVSFIQIIEKKRDSLIEGKIFNVKFNFCIRNMVVVV